MKCIRPLLVVMAVALITFGLSGYAPAFHDGGVAHCDGCHSMHSSPEGAFSLLIASDIGSTCLDCHQGGWEVGRTPNYHVFSTDGSVQSPGGDFFWLSQSYSVNVGWTTKNFNGYDKGHNIVASDFGLNSGDDADNPTAPGSTSNYPQSMLSCNSCHNPHGGGGTDQLGNADAQLPISGSGSYGATPAAGTRLGNYRLLYDQDDGDDVPGLGPISIDAPQAVTAGYIETDASHPAYQSGMSDFCGLCHDQFLPGGGGNEKHPVNESLGADIAQNYNYYRATGDYAAVNAATAYLPLVAYEEASVNNTPTNTAGPGGGAQVSCITCHRSHASAFDYMARWQLDTEFLADQIPTLDQVPAMADDTVPYYGRDITSTFGEFQRQLCNKCHVQD
jgi:predicted CXXCH cytochrome family protein